MKLDDYLIRYYPETEITCYPWVYHDRFEHYLPGAKNGKPGHQRTGPMDLGAFNRLKDDIARHGVENPFIIEYYRKHLPNAAGVREDNCLAIRTGNNRAEAMQQLGLSRGPALFVVPRRLRPELPSDRHRNLPLDRTLELHVSRLWHEVVRGNDAPLGIKGAWRDCELLVDLIRMSKDV